MLKRLIDFSLIGFFALALAGSSVAFAQDEDPCDGGDGDACAGDGDGDGDGGDGGDSAASAPSDGIPAGGGYPVAYLARPRVLPAGAWEAGLDLSFISGADFIVVGGVTPGALAQSGGLSFQYGIMDKLAAGVSYAFALKEFEIKGAVNINAQYLIVHSDSMQVRADVLVGYNLAGESLGPIGAGATIQYNLGDKMAVLSSPALFIDNEILDVQPISIRLPLGFGYQVADNFYAQVDTLLATIKVADSANAFIGADFLPLNLTGIYSLNNTLDVGANIGFGDLLNNAGDNLYFGVMARYRGGV